ncbi:hypothetical protein [Mesorhizobium sp. 1B3]|uniref:hypothetical protein n=1 Tax=Mesorhizobium sp. 1B3 TaxID=3243599 RepID=UPI003D97DEA0
MELVTRAAGTVYLCHPFLVHAAQSREQLRFLAAGAVAEGRVDPALFTIAGSDRHPPVALTF